MSYLNAQTRDRIHRLVNDLDVPSLQAVEVVSKCQIVPVVSGLGLAHCILRIDIGLKIRKRRWFSSDYWVGFTECTYAQNMDAPMRRYQFRRAAQEVEEEVSQCLYEAVRARVSKSQFPNEQEYLDNFSEWFQFAPARLIEARYQKEALLKLAFFASRVKECAKVVEGNPQGSRESYEDAFNAFNKRLECLEHFSPEFASTIPHWSELPVFIQQWLEGQVIENPPE